LAPDSTEAAQAELLEQIVAELKQEPSHMLPVYTFLQRRKREVVIEDDILATGATWDVPSLARLPEDFKIGFIKKRSQFTTPHLFDLLKADSSSLDILIQLAVQVPPRVKLPSVSRFQEVITRFLESRYEECGDRLRNLSATNAVNTQGFLNFLVVGCYSLVFDEAGEKVKSVVHASGDRIDLPSGAVFTKEYSLCDNFDDWGANLCLAPMPAVPLASFFQASKSGPWNATNFVGKPKQLASVFDGIFRAWEQEARAAMSAGSADAEIALGLQEHKREISQVLMQKARDMAKSAMSKKKARRSVALSNV
jgi:hypothetical protein